MRAQSTVGLAPCKLGDSYQVFVKSPVVGRCVRVAQCRLCASDAHRPNQNLPMAVAVAVVDNAGQLVAFERMDNTQTGSIGV